MLTTNLPPQQISLLNRCFHPTGCYVEFKKAEIEQSLSDRFESQVSLRPDRLAVKTRAEELTYDELNRSANRVAHSILAKIGKGQEPVALLFEQSAAAIVAILGTLKAGKIYVPLDISLPENRLKFILNNTSARLLLTNDENLKSAGEIVPQQSQVMNIDDCDPNLSTENPGLQIDPHSPASITYTSGSTGEPKGVVHNHRSILHFCMNSANYFHISDADRLIPLSSFSVHAGTHIIFPTLCNGASLYPLDLRQEGLNRAGEWIAQQGITIYFSVPTVFRQIASSLKDDDELSTVRLVELAGEQVNHRDVAFFKRNFSGDCLFVNRLGSTETDGYSLYFMGQETRFESTLVPGGYPVRDKEVLLLDEEGQAIASDGVGEIAVRSPFIGVGYWKLPELTRSVFQEDPDGEDRRVFHTGDLGQRLPDGSLMHLGRKDFQVKIRGYRVEVAEIELALIAHDAVKDSVVTTHENWRGEKRLVAYLVGHRKKIPSHQELRSFLKPMLPDYMIPSSFVRMDSLPKLPNGKIDRNALPPPGQGRPDLKTPFVRPRTPMEQTLADIWAQDLEIDRVGRNDDFLDLGGDSLSAAAMLIHVEETFQKKLPLAALIEASTVAQMAKILRQEGCSPLHTCLVAIQPKGEKSPFFCVHGLGGHSLGFAALARHLGEDQPFYGLESPGRDGEQEPLTRIEAMAARYIKEIQTVQEEGPYFLGGYSMGGVIAFEMAQQLQAEGHEVALLALFDSNCHGLVGGWRRRREFVLRELRNSPKLLQLNPTTHRRIIREKAEIVAMSTITYSPVDKPNRQALRRYKPGSYPGRIDLFWAVDRPEGPSDPRWGWQELAKQGVEVHRIPGDHQSILREPQLQTLAERLKACLDEALSSK